MAFAQPKERSMTADPRTKTNISSNMLIPVRTGKETIDSIATEKSDVVPTFMVRSPAD
jgi:hypothetical protein